MEITIRPPKASPPPSHNKDFLNSRRSPFLVLLLCQSSPHASSNPFLVGALPSPNVHREMVIDPIITTTTTNTHTNQHLDSISQHIHHHPIPLAIDVIPPSSFHRHLHLLLPASCPSTYPLTPAFTCSLLYIPSLSRGFGIGSVRQQHTHSTLLNSIFRHRHTATRHRHPLTALTLSSTLLQSKRECWRGYE